MIETGLLGKNIDKKKKKNINNFKYISLTILTGIVFFLICLGSLFSNLPTPLSKTTVSGNSMLPTLKNNDILTVNTNFTELKRGDIVIANPSVQVNRQVVKRIIGLPGDIIQIKNKELYVNDSKLVESYVNWNKESAVDIKLHTLLKIPRNCYFILGDNRAVSIDSRTYGPVSVKNILGKVL